MNRPRVVLDTNLLISAALLERSVPRQALELAFRHGEVLSSSETLTELKEVFARRKFDRYVSQEMRLRFLANFLNLIRPIEITETITACRDPKDNKFLELAVSGNATHLVTGDTDLLLLHPFRGILVLTPSDFINTFLS